LVSSSSDLLIVRSMSSLSDKALSLSQAIVGKQPRQVVQAVAPRLGVPFHQAVAEQLAQRILRQVGIHLPHRCCPRPVKGAGEGGQHTPQALQFHVEQIVAQVQRGLDQCQLCSRVPQPPHIVGRFEVRPLGQRAAGQAQGQGQAGAQCGDFAGVLSDARGDLAQERPRVGGRQRVQVQRIEAGQRKVLPRGDQQHAALWRDQWGHLPGARHVVHQQQCALPVQQRAVHCAQLRFALGQPYGGLVGADHVGHGLGGGQGRRVGALEVEEELRVGVAGGDLASRPDRFEVKTCQV
jgi:hypothetical protein